MKPRMLGLIGFLVVTGCASSAKVDQQATNATPEDIQINREYGDNSDPLESLNRDIWDFNWEVLDKAVLRPVAVSYRENVPAVIRQGVYNAVLNLEEPASVINNLLQGEIEGTLTSFWRFAINSSVGLLGVMDVAGDIGLARHEEEFGEVLGRWGVNTGPYLMLPAMGPNDLRSGAGDVIDGAYFPLADLNIYLSILRGTVKALEGRADLVAQEQIIDNSLDAYSFVKEAYFQSLESKVNNGASPKKSAQEDELEDEFDAFLDDM